jgi:hypothetical protein
MSNLLKGRIGSVHTVHWLSRYSPYTGWAQSFCKNWAGIVELAMERESVNCVDCAAMDPLKLDTTEESDE